MKLEIGQLAPDFSLPSHLDKNVRLSDLRGRNVVIAFFPKAWTPVCTGQIPSYEADHAKFVGLNAQVLGISIDHVPSLKAWANSLGGINYPLLSDFWPHAAVIEKFGVLRSAKGDAERAIFILDKDGIIRYIDVHDVDQQPPTAEILAFLRKLDPEAAAKAPVEAENTSPLPTGGIVMYCTPWCSDCRTARAWLAKEGLPYTEVDISRDNRAAKQVRLWANGNQTTPTFEINGKIVVDFHPEKIKDALKG